MDALTLVKAAFWKFIGEVFVMVLQTCKPRELNSIDCTRKVIGDGLEAI